MSDFSEGGWALSTTCTNSRRSDRTRTSQPTCQILSSLLFTLVLFRGIGKYLFTETLLGQFAPSVPRVVLVEDLEGYRVSGDVR